MIASDRTIVPAMIGTAGHVDHGKTALVKHLTGLDTDTLVEEKKRGLTIELGFAPCPLQGGRMAGIVDVPGHEDFIKNMIAGASVIDVLMLIIAADDGIMPQTVEHLKIVSLLRKPLVMAVITKSDLAGEDELCRLEADVFELLSANGFYSPPVVRFSAVTGEGLHVVRKELDLLVSKVRRGFDDRAFRLNIEKVFPAKGYGTVFTGVPVSGIVSCLDNLMLLPQRQKCSLRMIQGYRQNLDTVGTGICAALNVKGVSHKDVAKGMTAVTDDVYETSADVVVTLNNISENISLPRISDNYFLAGTSKCAVSVRLIDKDLLQPKEKCYARLILKENIALAAGDHYIIRLQNPNITFGGGIVLTANPPGKRKELHLNLLELAEKKLNEGDDFFCAAIAGSDFCVSAKNRYSRDEKTSLKHLRRLEECGSLIKVDRNLWLVKEKIPLLAERIEAILSAHHKLQPKSSGLNPASLASMAGLGSFDPDVYAEILAPFVKIKNMRGNIALETHTPSMSQQELKIRAKVVPLLEDADKGGLAVGKLADSLAMSPQQLLKTLKEMEKDGLLRLCENYAVSKKAYDEISADFMSMFGEQEFLGLEHIKKITGGGRHYLIALMESFDRDGLTKRTDKGRIKNSR